MGANNHPNSLKNLRPPVKGEVRNPAGRPKGSKNVASTLQKLLDKMIEVKDKESNSKSSMSVMDALNQAMVREAAAGNVQAYRELMDRAFGKVKQDMDVTTDGGPITTMAPVQIILNELPKTNHEQSPDKPQPEANISLEIPE